MASFVSASNKDLGLKQGEVSLAGTSPEMTAAFKMGPNSATATPSDLLSDAYNVRSKLSSCGDVEKSGKLFPSLVLKVDTISPDPPLKNLPEAEEDSSARRVQPPRQARLAKGDLTEDWLNQHLQTAYPNKESWRALELFTEDKLYEAFPYADITAQPTEVPGIRPDFVLKHGGKTVVVDSKCFSRSNIRKRSDVDKLLSDMGSYDASSGIMVVRDKGRISEDLERYCVNNGVIVLEANRQLADNLYKVIDFGTARMPSKGLKHGEKDVKARSKLTEKYEKEDPKPGLLKKDLTLDMRFKANHGIKDSNPDTRKSKKKEVIREPSVKAKNQSGEPTSTVLGPLKKDGTPDLRFKCNYELKPVSRMRGPLKNDGTLDMRFKVNYEQLPKTEKSKAKVDIFPELLPSITDKSLGPLKKDGTPDMRFKSNSEPKIASPISCTTHGGPLKKDGTPDMRYKSNYGPAASSSQSSSKVSSSGFYGSQSYTYNGYSSGPLTKSGLPDMRYKANRY